ncbi:MAG TPA: hypothetical protein VMX17_07195 [Candidatus Glassbacteria bacterium]|nr:hypothetical protein [Candidatus Glassbacteria bacterium]
MKAKERKFIFGVFCKGKLIFHIGMPIECNHFQAAIIVGILDMAKHVLLDGHYFACDFVNNIKGMRKYQEP